MSKPKPNGAKKPAAPSTKGEAQETTRKGGEAQEGAQEAQEGEEGASRPRTEFEVAAEIADLHRRLAALHTRRAKLEAEIHTLDVALKFLLRPDPGAQVAGEPASKPVG